MAELATDSFELKRVMRQEAHEKAFEIKVISQRLFEKEKARIVAEGKKEVDKKMDKMRRDLQTELNIKRSTQINKARMKKMNYRNDLMGKLIEEATVVIKNEIADPQNDEYKDVIKNLIMQSMMQLLENKVRVKCRERDYNMISEVLTEVEEEYAAIMKNETGDDSLKCELELINDAFIKEDDTLGKCGGVILSDLTNRIVTSNLLLDRLKQSYDESLPVLRHMLFTK